MLRSAEQLHNDALQIWQAGLARVRSDRLIHDSVRIEGATLWLADTPIELDSFDRLVVVGAGKAGAGMAAALEEVLGAEILRAKSVTGWINVPSDCVRPLRAIHLHAAREPGVNEPSPAGQQGAEKILEIVAGLNSRDLCIALISGGGSALLPAPAVGITLADTLAVTAHLSAAGATIEQLNTVRKQLSRIKGGGLARHCRAGRLVALIVSDVLGDPLDLIASGPTVADPSNAQAALDVLHLFQAAEHGVRPEVFDYLRRKPSSGQAFRTQVTNLVIGNNALAVDAAGIKAEQLGYSHAMISATRSEGPAEGVGRHLAQQVRQMAAGNGPDCLISGGEPVVELVESAQRGRGGRNQQLVLAAAEELGSVDRFALLSAGTDGEDGPTDAAGAIIDGPILTAAKARRLDPADFLARNDAYHFFQPLEALIKTGPTNTNVCDLRVITVSRESAS